jgi:fibronectin type 3 domain-containing protein
VPSTPSNVTAAATAPTSVQLTWGASTETGGTIASYQISRNGTQLASAAGSATSFTDSTAQPGTAYTYAVTAVDASGNTSQPGTSNTVTTPLLATGFESGNLTDWSPVTGAVTLQTGAAHAGTYAAQLSSTGGQTFALQNLPGSASILYAQGWANVASQSTSMTLFGLRTPTTQVAQLYLNPSGTIKVLNNVTKASYLSTTTVPQGSWHQLTFAVNETAGTMQVWLDGSQVQFATSAGLSPVLTGQNLGTVPMSNFQLGDDATGRTYSWRADDLIVSTTQPSF